MKKINKNILRKNTVNNIQTNNFFKFNNKNFSDVNIRLRKKRQKTSIISTNSLTNKNLNSNEFSSNDKSKTKSKLQLNTLYESIKSKPQLNIFEINDINSYFNQNGKKIKNNLKLMDIISQAKKSIHKYDIEQKTKKIAQSNLSSKQQDKLSDLKEINNQIELLPLYYMNNIFDFKSKTLVEYNEIKV